MTTTIGPYTQGERPDPLLHTFEDAEGNPIDLTGYTASAVEQSRRSGESEALACTIPGPSDGTVRVDWGEPFTVGGTHLLDVTVASEGPIYVSQRFRYYVRPAFPTP